MDEPEYLKCACKECGTHIEFPRGAAHTTVTCPNCGQWTELTAPAGTIEQKGTTINLGWVAVIALVILAAAGALWWYHTQQAGGGSGQGIPVAKAAPKPVAPIVPTNPPVIVAPQAVAVTPEKPKPKSHEDLKVGEIKLEKTPNTSLVYAVGTVTNDSTWQRFGVKVELDLFNAQDKKIGTTQDQTGILEPHQAWEFRALIPEKKAASAKLNALTEGE